MTGLTAAGRLDAVLRGEAVPWHALVTTPSELLRLCEALEISGLVHQQLTQSVHDWPEAVVRELAMRSHAATATALVRASESAAVLQALAASDIQPILLKGVPLAHGLYAAPGLRPHADTDVMVRRDQVDDVKRIMSGLGYVEPPFSDGELLFCQFQMTRDDRFGIAHVFDVHWKISTQTVFADVLTYEELAVRAEPVPALGPHARAAGREDALLLACIHPVMHHRNAERLIWSYDLHLLASRLSDAELQRFALRAIDKQVAAVCLHQLLLTRARFHTRLPDGLTAALSSPRSGEPSGTYLQAGRRWHDELLSNMRGLAGWRDRLRLMREVTLPSPDYMVEAYGVGRHGRVLLPMLYVHRLGRGVWKVVRGRK
jgi:Uncharacterised nucleotidyltransferase